MNLTVAVRELHPRQAFRISRARRDAVCNVFVRIEHAGISGFGEASPNSFYGETAQTVAVKLREVQPALQNLRLASVADLERSWEELWPALSPSRAAQCALDIALWDWLAKHHNQSVTALAWGTSPAPVPSFCTIGLSTPEELPGKIAELAGFPRIKLKSDQQADLAAVRAVRAAHSGMIVVDANCAWEGADLDCLGAELRKLGIEFIEQPFAPGREAALKALPKELPVLADESCVTEADVAFAAAHYSGFNIKLVKCGGITPALRMLKQGRALGQKIMVGCMLESSALIAAGAVLAQRSDYADLDGAWLLGDDPFSGWDFQRGILSPPAGPGLGVAPSPAMVEAFQP